VVGFPPSIGNAALLCRESTPTLRPLKPERYKPTPAEVAGQLKRNFKRPDLHRSRSQMKTQLLESVRKLQKNVRISLSVTPRQIVNAWAATQACRRGLPNAQLLFVGFRTDLPGPGNGTLTPWEKRHGLNSSATLGCMTGLCL